MDKNSKEYKKLKIEMDNYLKNKEKQREKQRLNSLGFSRGVYPSTEYQKILKKRYKDNNQESDNKLLQAILYIAIIILVLLFLISMI